MTVNSENTLMPVIVFGTLALTDACVRWTYARQSFSLKERGIPVDRVSPQELRRILGD